MELKGWDERKWFSAQLFLLVSNSWTQSLARFLLKQKGPLVWALATCTPGEEVGMEVKGRFMLLIVIRTYSCIQSSNKPLLCSYHVPDRQNPCYPEADSLVGKFDNKPK